MSRSGYIDGYEEPDINLWRGQVASAIRGKRGQAFLRELVDALDAMSVKVLIAHNLKQEVPAFVPPQIATEAVCAIGVVGVRRGVPLNALDPEDYYKISDTFNIAHQLVREIEWINDEAAFETESPEERWSRVRAWAVSQLHPLASKSGAT